MISSISKKDSMTIIKQVVKVNLEDDYYFKLYNLLETSYLLQKINLYHIFHFLFDSNNCVSLHD